MNKKTLPFTSININNLYININKETSTRKTEISTMDLFRLYSSSSLNFGIILRNFDHELFVLF